MDHVQPCGEDDNDDDDASLIAFTPASELKIT